jgi:hypothetical protein
MNRKKSYIIVDNKQRSRLGQLQKTQKCIVARVNGNSRKQAIDTFNESGLAREIGDYSAIYYQQEQSFSSQEKMWIESTLPLLEN